MTHGACASGDPYSAAAGRDALAAGGNAVDAAVAAALMATFTVPTMTSLGGGGVMMLRVDGKTIVCDHFARLPGLGFTGERREADVLVVPFEGVRLPFRVGRPTIAVPGAVAGLFEIHERYGRMPLAEVAAPTIRAAREGVVVKQGQSRAFALLEPILRRTPGSWALVGAADRVLEPGETLRNAPLADALSALVDDGVALFYEGEMADRIVEVSEGCVTREDLAAYEPVFSEPLTGNYRNWRVLVPGAPSMTGGQILVGLEHLAQGGPMPRFDTPSYWERIAESQRACEALRDEDYERGMFDDGYVAGRVADHPGGSTMQLSAVDEHGNAVAYTTTVGESAGFVIPGTGILLNNFMGEEDILPEHMAPVPGVRMLTAMCPTLLERKAGAGHDGDSRLVALGAAGSARIRSAVLQVAVHVMDSGLVLQEAVAHPRIHVEGETIYIEAHGRTPEEVTALQPLGRESVMTYEAGFFFGGVQAARVNAEGFSAAADVERRGCQGYVV